MDHKSAQNAAVVADFLRKQPEDCRREFTGLSHAGTIRGRACCSSGMLRTRAGSTFGFTSRAAQTESVLRIAGFLAGHQTGGSLGGTESLIAIRRSDTHSVCPRRHGIGSASMTP